MRWRRLAFLAMVAAAVAGCEEQEVLIDVAGTLYGCNDPDACDGVAEASVELLDLEVTPRAEAVTDADGDFRLEQVPGNNYVFLLGEHWPEYVPVAFLGTTGSVDGNLEDGSFFLVELAEAQASIDAFGAAHPEQQTVQTIDPDTDNNGGMVRGVFKTAIDGLLPQDWPGRDRLTCHFEDPEGERYPCVYLDVDGNPDWSLDTTTFHGGFAAFGLPEGLYTGVLFDGQEDEAADYALFYTYVPEDGIAIFDYFTSPF